MEGWRISKDYPGYRYKDIQTKRGRTHRVYRPILTPEQEAVVHEQVKRELTAALGSYYRRTGHLPGEGPTARTVAG